MGKKKWVNSFTEVEDLGNRRFGATIHVGHKVFKDKADGEWKAHKLTDERPQKNYVLIQSAKCCIEVYPYYAVYYDVNHKEVRVYNSRWVVEEWTGHRWKDLGFWNPTLLIEDIDNGIKVVREGQTTDGTLKIEYTQYDGAPLKHTVTWTNTSSESKTIRFILAWAGIVGNKITCSGSEYSPPCSINDGEFIFGSDDNPKSICEILWNEFNQGILNPVSIETHAKGMKADFIFEEFVVTPSESGILDPLTWTNDNPTKDGSIYHYNGNYFDQAHYASVAWGYRFLASVHRYWRGYVEWNLTSIPDSSIIDVVKFQYHGAYKTVVPSSIRHMALRPSTASTKDVYDDAGDGTVYLDDNDTFPEVGTNKEVGGSAVPWDTDPKTDLQDRLIDNWFAIGIKTTEVTDPGHLDEFWSEEYAGANPKPTLYVEYTVPRPILSYSDGLVCVLAG